MTEETIISWTPANWITVLLMVVLGSTVLDDLEVKRKTIK